MFEVLQWLMGGLAIAGFVVLGRMDATIRARRRIDQAHRRNVAQNKQTMLKLRQSQAHWEQLNQKRHALNERYSETIERMRAHHGIKDEE